MNTTNKWKGEEAKEVHSILNPSIFYVYRITFKTITSIEENHI